MLIDIKKDPREVDVEVASILYHVERLKVKWYPLEILAFYEEGNPLMRYSYDKDACNARMYANGENEQFGYARSLPFYSTDLGAFQEVIDFIRRHGDNLSVGINPDNCLVSVQTSYGACSIEAPAPAGGVTLDNSDIALAGCFAFLKAYQE